jgi:polysaccharide biosynthesis/export protein
MNPSGKAASGMLRARSSQTRSSQTRALHQAVLAAAVAAAALLGGCGVFNNYPPAPTTVDTVDHRYKIGPLDTLSISVWRNPDLSATVSVRPDGRISSPLVEDLMAAGRSPVDLARDIEKTLAKFIREPVVTVVVGGFQGMYPEQIRIVGEAARPQSVPYRQQMTLLDVMIAAGGLTDFADGNGAVLVRGSEGGKQYSIRLKDLLKRGDISANVAVKPGDIVIVPQSLF